MNDKNSTRCISINIAWREIIIDWHIRIDESGTGEEAERKSCRYE